ncbi:SIR2 family protein [Streptomyces sp. NPDC007251]|uniref:SIR2 family protein n=1 Tax=Streptomyces sp. NPDC007251 TaxID=3154483 RepID=UPI0033D0C1F7
MTTPQVIPGRTRPLLFIGSGLSRAIGIRSWTDLLREVAEISSVPASDRNEVYRLTNAPGSEYSAADILATAIGERALRGEISAILKHEQTEIANSPGVTKWFRAIDGTDPAGVITTNWDTLLEDSCAGLHPLKWPRDDELLKHFLRRGEPFLLYIHGNIKDEDLVVTSEHRTSVENRLKLDVTLQQLLVNHYTFVIGYGFPDVHIVKAFEKAHSYAGTGEQISYIIDRESATKKAFPPSGSIVGRFSDFSEFQAALNEMANLFDPSVRLLQISEARSADELRAAVSPQVYNSVTTSSLCDAIRKNRNPEQITELAANLILDDPENAQTSGILSTVLSQIPELWKPDQSTLLHLDNLASREMRDDNLQLIGIIEPLSFALGMKGSYSRHRDYLCRVIDSYSWRNADEKRIRSYYGRADVRINAYERHHKDSRRTGMLLAHDITRLVSALESGYSATEKLFPQLDGAIDILARFGEFTAVERMSQEVDQLKQREADLHQEDVLKWKAV